MPAVCGQLGLKGIVFCPRLTSLFLLCVCLCVCVCVCVAGWGAVAYCGGAEKDSRGAHEAGAGPSETAEGGAENHPRQGQVQAQALLLPEGHRMKTAPPSSTCRAPAFIPTPPSRSPSSSFDPTPPPPPPLWNARFVLEVLKEGRAEGRSPVCWLVPPAEARVAAPGLEEEAALRPGRTWLLPPSFLTPPLLHTPHRWLLFVPFFFCFFFSLSVFIYIFRELELLM